MLYGIIDWGGDPAPTLIIAPGPGALQAAAVKAIRDAYREYPEGLPLGDGLIPKGLPWPDGGDPGAWLAEMREMTTEPYFDVLEEWDIIRAGEPAPPQGELLEHQGTKATTGLAYLTFLELAARRTTRETIRGMVADLAAEGVIGITSAGAEGARVLGNHIRNYVTRLTVGVVTGAAITDVDWTEVARWFLRRNW